MQAFLHKLTSHIYQMHKGHLGEVCLVLPNRRAALFIRKYLAGMIERTTFLPGFYAIEDFVLESSRQVLMDSLGLQFTMYELHHKIHPDEVRPIEEFLPYANWMLSDFNEIDMYLVDPVKLYTHLGDVKALSLWDPGGRPLNDFEKRYLGFVRSIGTYYHELKSDLSAQGLAYQGMAFREMAENIESLAAKMQWKKVIFAGFNALTPAEEKIIKFMMESDRAEVYWDADKYYTGRNGQEAGDFLRGYFKTLTHEHVMWEEDHFSLPKKIHVIGVPKNTAQVKYAGEILMNMHRAKASLDNTAIVLPDENLLIPMLNSIPPETGEFNVTMGLSLRDTPFYSLLQNIINLHENAERVAGIKGSGKKTYYARDLVRIFSHPWFSMMLGEDNSQDIPHLIRSSNSVFFDREAILALLPPEHAVMTDPTLLFPDNAGPEGILDTFMRIIGILRAHVISTAGEESARQPIELEYLYQFNSLFTRMHDLLDRKNAIQSLKTFKLVFRQMAAQQRIPFYGEPLKGLQVMGVLETRTLDFENLVMLSVNEGVIPAARQHNSFIPHDIRKEFGLPTYKYNNKVFAHHFYRLLQRAQNIYLLYNTEGGQLGGAEKSRYIVQLLHEIRQYNPTIEISEEVVTLPPATGHRDSEIVIRKTAELIDLIRREGNKGFHPSSLNLYINCPLQFYLARLMRIEEVEEKEETIDNRLLGIIMHETLRVLFGRYIGTPVSSEAMAKIRKALKDELKTQFHKEMQQGDLEYGKNHIIVAVAEKQLDQLMAREHSWLGGTELQILELEKRFQVETAPDPARPETKVHFAGTADRVDSFGGHTRILDYKTGYVDEKKLAPKEWAQIFTDPDFGKAFQLIMYAWLYHKQHASATPLQAGIISLRKPGNGPMLVRPPEHEMISREALVEFESGLNKLMQEILDPEIPFRQAEDEKRCKYCSFTELCNRVSAGNNDWS